MKVKLIILLAVAATFSGFAQETGTSTDAQAPSWVYDLVVKYPVVATILIAIGALRLALKPVFTIWHQVVESTPDTKDDEFLAKVENSKILKAIVYVLDWLASVKLVK